MEKFSGFTHDHRLEGQELLVQLSLVKFFLCH